MFNPHISVPSRNTDEQGNWEKDVHGVALEPCDALEDPMGLRAVFFIKDEKPLTQRTNCYCVGASYLRQRLDGIRRAGFEAPMTARALELVEESLKDRKAGNGV